jgi:hypothetical protein
MMTGQQMKTHRPNSIPLQLRALSAVAVLGLLLYALAALLTGHAYVPGKRGGLFLAGLPTLLLVFAALCASVAATLTLVDHYDRRPNEAAYRNARRNALRLALYAFLAAPFVQLLDALLLLAGLDLLPRFEGLAPHSTLHSPQLRGHLPRLAPLLAASVPLALASFGAIGLGLLLHARWQSRTRRAVLVLLSLGLLGLATVTLTHSFAALLRGEVQPGSRHRAPVTAQAQPAKFNAVLLTRFGVGGLLLVGSATVLVVAAWGRRASGGGAPAAPLAGPAIPPPRRRPRRRKRP